MHSKISCGRKEGVLDSNFRHVNEGAIYICMCSRVRLRTEMRQLAHAHQDPIYQTQFSQFYTYL
jgi:hypothetical protein